MRHTLRSGSSLQDPPPQAPPPGGEHSRRHRGVRLVPDPTRRALGDPRMSVSACRRRGQWQRGPGGGRRARRGDVRAALLLLIEGGAQNGYQLIQEIERRTDGVWNRSVPGAAAARGEGLVHAVEFEGKHAYELTDEVAATSTATAGARRRRSPPPPRRRRGRHGHSPPDVPGRHRGAMQVAAAGHTDEPSASSAGRGRALQILAEDEPTDSVAALPGQPASAGRPPLPRSRRRPALRAAASFRRRLRRPGIPGPGCQMRLVRWSAAFGVGAFAHRRTRPGCAAPMTGSRRCARHWRAAPHREKDARAGACGGWSFRAQPHGCVAALYRLALQTRHS